MDFKNFSEIYGALGSAENELRALGITRGTTVEKIAAAKQRLLAQFGHFCPESVATALKLPNFDCGLFLSLLVRYPETVSGNEEKILKFFMAAAKYERRHQGRRIFLNEGAMTVLAGGQMFRYMLCHQPAEDQFASFVKNLRSYERKFPENEDLKKFKNSLRAFAHF